MKYILELIICEHLPVNVADLVYNSTSSANIKKILTKQSSIQQASTKQALTEGDSNIILIDNTLKRQDFDFVESESLERHISFMYT